MGLDPVGGQILVLHWTKIHAEVVNHAEVERHNALSVLIINMQLSFQTK